MKKIAAAAALALFVATPGFATTTIDFEAVPSFTSVADFYSGLAFGGDALAFANDAVGTYFSNAPSPIAVMSTVGTDSTMNAVAGLTGSISFYYSANSAVVGGVQVWSGLDGAGSRLASFDLTANAQGGGCAGAYCHFDQAGGAFSGVAHSVTFSNSFDSVNGSAAFDDITVALVPEPSSLAMMALGLGGLAVVARRRRG